MLNDRIIRITFFISLSGHLLLLGMPRFNIGLSQPEKPKEVTVRIEIEKPPLLPKIDVMGEKKRLKTKDREQNRRDEGRKTRDESKKTEDREEQKIEPEEVVMEQPLKEPIEEDIEVVNPAREAMLRYQDMVKQRIEGVRRYPTFAKRQAIEGNVHLNFVVLSNGLSKDTKIVSSSGFRILDQEAVSTIQRANPFPPIPPQINQDFVAMELGIVFVLD